MTFDVVVVGSANRDLTVHTPRHPAPGETVLGHGHRWGPGGKGANQAVAAARMGSTTALVARVGDDEHGRLLTDALRSSHVDDRWLSTSSTAPTGVAMITVDDTGENTIVVSPGANDELGAEEIAACSDALAAATVVISQLEVSLPVVEAAARAAGGRFFLNPAPARSLPDDLLGRVEVLIPNRSELAVLANTSSLKTIAQVADAAGAIHGPGSIVVTLGPRGCLVIADGATTHIRAPEVEAVDTTGAGDAFCGALADGLCRGMPIKEAARWATLAGALAVTREGAQSAMPTRAEVEALAAS